MCKSGADYNEYNNSHQTFTYLNTYKCSRRTRAQIAKPLRVGTTPTQRPNQAQLWTTAHTLITQSPRSKFYSPAALSRISVSSFSTDALLTTRSMHLLMITKKTALFYSWRAKYSYHRASNPIPLPSDLSDEIDLSLEGPKVQKVMRSADSMFTCKATFRWLSKIAHATLHMTPTLGF